MDFHDFVKKVLQFFADNNIPLSDTKEILRYIAEHTDEYITDWRV